MHYVDEFSLSCTYKLTFKIWLKMGQWFLRKASIEFPYVNDILTYLHASEFSQEFTNNLNKCITLFDQYMVIGDLNHDSLNETKGKPLANIMELFDLTNLIQKPTCFMKDCKPSLLDVILTISKSLCMKTLNFGTGISDWHNMISIVINNQIPKNEKYKSQYKSFRSVDTDALNTEMKDIQLTGIDGNDCRIHTVFGKFENDIRNIFDKHVPIKERYMLKQSATI